MYTSKYFVQSFDACVAARLFESLDRMCPAGTIHGNHGFSMRWIVPSVQSGGGGLSLLKIHNLEQVSLLQVPDIQKETYFIHSSCWSAHLSPDKLCCFNGMLNPCKGGFCSGERKIGQYSCTSHRAEHIMTHYLSTKTHPWAGCDGLGWADVTARSGKTAKTMRVLWLSLTTLIQSDTLLLLLVTAIL